MNWMNKLERKIGKYAIPNLMFYVIMLYIVGFAISIVSPAFYYSYLALNAEAILHGQIWRVVTFLVQPPNTSAIFMVFALYLYYVIGKSLEYAWGTFRFNLYFFMGVIFHVVAALVTYFLTGLSLPLGTFYINLSLFFAYAVMFPNEEFLLLMVLPVKVKYLAWLDAAYFAYTIIQAFLPAYGGSAIGILYKANALAAAVSILNFLIFWLALRKQSGRTIKDVRRKQQFKREIHRAQEKQKDASGARHRCAVCGRTELDDPNLEFRYCSKCNGAYEYCQDHLFTHEHVK